jgi:NDP-sugar pyrophosphorylase family protein
MKAMVLAAGLGTRLREITKTKPKCLVEAGGKTMLQHVLERLRGAGVSEVVINLHYLGDQIESYLQMRDNFGLKIQFSREAELLGTGGGLKNAAALLGNDSDFFLYNADIYCELDLEAMLDAHRRSGVLATLAVMDRKTSRYLLFDAGNRLAGWHNPDVGESKLITGATLESCSNLAFSGIHVISPEFFAYMQEDTGSFSIIRSYLRAAERGRAVEAYRIDDSFWVDVGTPEKLAELDMVLQNRRSERC